MVPHERPPDGRHERHAVRGGEPQGRPHGGPARARRDAKVLPAGRGHRLGLRPRGAGRHRHAPLPRKLVRGPQVPHGHALRGDGRWPHLHVQRPRGQQNREAVRQVPLRRLQRGLLCPGRSQQRLEVASPRFPGAHHPRGGGRHPRHRAPQQVHHPGEPPLGDPARREVGRGLAVRGLGDGDRGRAAGRLARVHVAGRGGTRPQGRLQRRHDLLLHGQPHGGRHLHGTQGPAGDHPQGLREGGREPEGCGHGVRGGLRGDGRELEPLPRGQLRALREQQEVDAADGVREGGGLRGRRLQGEQPHARHQRPPVREPEGARRPLRDQGALVRPRSGHRGGHAPCALARARRGARRPPRGCRHGHSRHRHHRRHVHQQHRLLDVPLPRERPRGGRHGHHLRGGPEPREEPDRAQLLPADVHRPRGPAPRERLLRRDLVRGLWFPEDPEPTLPRRLHGELPGHVLRHGRRCENSRLVGHRLLRRE
mmetsp:Transcript_43910/g.130046  ORF Transcript_43910/g.130046 Transcript_43910/m.130046 type:complete len:481 (+) Transcript_43910:1224-2666(+)